MQLVASHVGTSTSCTCPSATCAACNHLGTHRRIITRRKVICNSLAHNDLSPAADHLQQAALALAAAGVAGPALIEAAYNELVSPIMLPLRPTVSDSAIIASLLLAETQEVQGLPWDWFLNLQ